jgi:hypothetical protein
MFYFTSRILHLVTHFSDLADGMYQLYSQKCWIDNQHMVMWRVPISTHRQARMLITGPSPTAKTRLLSFNRTQSRVVTGQSTGHNTLGRYLYLMEMINSPLCRRCGSEKETSAHILWECEALASLRHAHLGFFFLNPKDVKESKSGGHLELH